MRSQGVLNLSLENMQTFLNVVHLEARKEVYISLNKNHQYSIKIAEINQEVNRLVGGLSPRNLVYKWMSGESIKTKPFKEEDTPWDDNDPMFETRRKNLEYKNK